jgi:hypothetical protein
MHPFHGVGIDAADRPVEHDSAPDLDPRHDFHHQRSAARRLGDVVLEQDAAHAFRLRQLCDVDIIHVAAEHVRMRVHVHVDYPGCGADLRRRRRETGLRERLGGGERAHDCEYCPHGAPP